MNHPQIPLFLTTAISYVNGEPHVGHALELLIADAYVRHQRQRGRLVRFTGGTDDHSLKNLRAAEALGIAPLEYVRRQGERFEQLPRALGVELDDYLHTSSDARHAPAVLALWERCRATGDLYQREYWGLYCNGCEAFISETELVRGGCAVHREPLERISETNWFFRLSRYEGKLLTLLQSGSLAVEPRERHNEVVSFVRQGLRDFSVSRSRARARGFGLGVPGDDSQVIYVWFDALANYLSLLGFPEEGSGLARYWSEAPAAREHLIGKDILRFHAVYWPALLLSAGLPLPTCIKTHGYVTRDGVKIGKSLGNGVDPFELVARFGIEAVRFYFLRHLHTTKDSDLRVERLIEAHDSELAGKLGNLLQRTASLAARHPELVSVKACTAPSDADTELAQAARHALSGVAQAVDDFALQQAVASILELVAAANRYADAQEPWTLSRKVRTVSTPRAAAELQVQLGHVLWHLFESLRVTAVLLAPFLPGTASTIATRLGVPPSELLTLERARFGLRQRYRPRGGGPLFPRLGTAVSPLTAPL
ncbi:MAG TPA: methionine--tRNA ligase [Polyangiaceae bacterium]|nr:methionine--tRNA ligase [Polyangiaceae bacterium]